MKLKPFDLEAAKRGDPICTRNGREAKFIAHVPDAGNAWKVVAMYLDDDGEKKAIGLYENGGLYENNDESKWDLVMAPRKVQLWVRAYRSKLGPYISQAKSRQDLCGQTNFGDPWIDPEPRLHGEYDE